jgi:NADH-quinone oxidoreductase subunit M
MVPLLTLTLFLPLIGALLLLAVPRASARASHATGIGAAALTLLGALAAWTRGAGPGFSQVEEISWIPSLGAAYRLGVDGISLSLVLLTGMLFLAALLFSADVRERPRSYVSLFLFLETSCLGVFLSLDLLLFYVFFELTLVGMYFIISGWGHEDRQRAAVMFFLYTLIGSLPLLLAILSLHLHTAPRTFDMRAIIAAPPLSGGAALAAFLAMLFTFAVKTPLFPLHSWLPAAHVQAPAPGSTILAGVLLKLGGYGFIRFALQMTPDAFRAAAPWVAAIAVFSALYGALVALAQTDLKTLVAYTSINHMGYVVLAVSAAAATADRAARTLAIDGATLQMVSHGLVTGVLFLLVGALQERTGTREMGRLGGLLARIPRLGWCFILGAFASLGLPGLAHFPAEFQMFLGAFRVWTWAASAAVIGLVLTAALYLRAIRSVFLGQPPERGAGMRDLGLREAAAVVPLLVLIVAIGVAPRILLDIIHGTAAKILP